MQGGLFIYECEGSLMSLHSKMERAQAKWDMQERVRMGDAEAFLGSYKEALAEEVTGGMWPIELSQVYEPESCLKHSGAKEVYLVKDRRTGGLVVLRASDLDAGERADAEHAILSRLNYPGIPKTFGTMMREGRSYLAREYFVGEPLDQVTARGTMQPAQIYKITLQICAILGYLHSQHPPVIHRDIKPQNIIKRPDGSIGLTDFGIARTFKEGSESDTQYMGTLLYAPPEQYGYAQSSPQTDIYALGIVLIYLATGSPDRRDLDRRITDPQLRALIEKCIAFDPKDRFQNVDQVIKRIRSMKTRKPRLIIGAATGCIVLALIGIGIWQLFAAGILGGGTAPVNLIDADDLISVGTNDYPSTGDPTIGSTNWLYDYNSGGNLQGNINNGGFAVPDYNNKTIYVSSGDSIYKLDEDGNILGYVYSGSVDGSLNIYNGSLYFSAWDGMVHKIDLESGEDTELGSISAESIYFDEGRMYFTSMTDDLKLYSAKTDGSGIAKVSDATNVHYTNIVDGIRYYSDEADGKRIYAQNLSTGDTALIYDAPAIWLSVCNGRIYFEDDTPGRLASINLDGSDYKIVYDQPCYFVVASSHGIFAVNAITKELVVVDATTSEVKTVLESGDKEFCVAGGWIFYRSVNSNTVQGMVREDGTDDRGF